MLLLGAVVDRIGPRAAIMVGDVIRFGATLFLAAAVTAGETGAWMWISAAVLVGLGEAFFYPAFGAATPLLVPEDRLASANGLRLGVQYVGSTIGPLLVGGLLAAGRLDVVFWAQALTFLIAAAAAVAIPGRVPARRVRRPSMLREAYDGIRFVLQRGYLVVAVAVLFVNVLLLDPSRFVFLPQHAASPAGLDLGSEGFAWLAATGGLGAIVGSLYWGRRERGRGRARAGVRRAPPLLLGVGWAMAGLPWAPVAFAGMAIAGFGIPGASVVLYAALQARVRVEHLGRTFAVVETVTYVGGPLGFAISTLLVDRVDPGLVVFAAGIGIALSGLAAALWMKGLDRA